MKRILTLVVDVDDRRTTDAVEMAITGLLRQYPRLQFVNWKVVPPEQVVHDLLPITERQYR